MLDSKLYTFLTLCELRHYGQTAERLHLSQPAVTQHIQALERSYGAKLFFYEGRRLFLSPQGQSLLQYARSAVYNDQNLRTILEQKQKRLLHIGATKTIGDYVLEVERLLAQKDLTVHLRIDNTKILLQSLDRFELDFACIEGVFDKTLYGHRLLRREPFVGICAKDHPFAGRNVSIPDLFANRLILREEGSGTRGILEQILAEQSYSFAHFTDYCVISSFELIKRLVRQNFGISFVYAAVLQGDPELASFTLTGQEILREFCYVYLKNTAAEGLLSYLIDAR